MYERHDVHLHRKGYRRIVVLALALTMLCYFLPVRVFAISVINSSSAKMTFNIPFGDYEVQYSTVSDGGFKSLTSQNISMGTVDGTQYDTLFLKVSANNGFSLDTVSANGVAVTPSNNVYSIDASGAASTINISISVTGVKITGKPAGERTLTAELSSNLNGQSLTYDWQSCNTATGTFESITGQDSETLVLTETMSDKYIRVVVTDSLDTEYISAPVGPVASDEIITFDLAQGNVEIGLTINDNHLYRGYNSAGALVSGIHSNANEYVVMQSDSSAVTSNRIILTGNLSKPRFNVLINDINCGNPSNKDKGGIYADASSSTPMEIILKLQGDNSIGRLHYATGQENQASQSSLTITSAQGNGSAEGSLTAVSTTPWSAAIGGIDETSAEASQNITIAGGTITATTAGSGATGTSAIGGGGNGGTNITISGGIVTASNCGTGATIGGGGGNSSPGGVGNITISGGVVNATNAYASGVAIGGGSSRESKGSNSTVNISGGSVTASGNIGGGSSIESKGGIATINILGGKVTVNSGYSICGGDSVNDFGGSATVNIFGGTVSTPRLSGGKNGDGTFKDANVTIKAASVYISDRSNISSVTGPDPVMEMETVVYCQELMLGQVTGLSGEVANIAVESATLTDGHTYELTDVYSDSSGKLYFWLPTIFDVTSLTIDGQVYDVEGAQVQMATITHDSSTYGSVLGAVINDGTATSYQWQKSTNGEDNWTDITGATSDSYTVDPDDINAGEYIRVVVSTADGPITSGNLLITNNPFASINYSSLEVPVKLSADLINGSGGIYTYIWQMYNSTAEEFQAIQGETGRTLTTDYSYVGKRVRVVITDQSTSYTTSFVHVRAPQVSISVPISSIVTINTSGECSVSNGAMTNTSLVPVYMTSVSFEWKTSGSCDANELFNDYTDVTASLMLSGTEYTFSGASPTTVYPTAAEGEVDPMIEDTPGTIPLLWDFTFGRSTHINLTQIPEDDVQLATISYTVEYTPPTS